MTLYGNDLFAGRWMKITALRAFLEDKTSDKLSCLVSQDIAANYLT